METRSPSKKLKSTNNDFIDDDDNECLTSVTLENLHCRKQQVKLLISLFGKKSHVTCPSVFIYGLSGTGKTYTVSIILQSRKSPYAVVNCAECFTSRLLFEITLNAVSQIVPTLANGYSNFANCDNSSDFVRHLKTALTVCGFDGSETYYIILDKVDYLRQLDKDVLPVFQRLQELMKINVCVIMISEIVWEKFRSSSGLCEPVQVHFPQYSADDICLILSRDPPDGYSKEFYENYVRIVLNVFQMVCGNLMEIRYLAEQNFPKYVEPIVNGLASESNIQKLWRNIEPQLKQAIHGVYMRESIMSRNRLQEDSSGTSIMIANTSKNRVELPFYSKYLLIASYMASYNPIRTDKRFFVKKHDKISKRIKVNSMKRHDKLTFHLLGPKSFQLDRLLAIFYSIVEDRVSPSAHIYSQISTLVTLNMLTLIGKDELDSPKYKCNVSLDFIRSIGRTVDFDVVKYLYDYL